MDATEAPPCLIQQVSVATGLPPCLVQTELLRIMSAYGINPNDLTLDLLRDLLVDYLQDTLVSAKRRLADV